MSMYPTDLKKRLSLHLTDNWSSVTGIISNRDKRLQQETFLRLTKSIGSFRR